MGTQSVLVSGEVIYDTECLVGTKSAVIVSVKRTYDDEDLMGRPVLSGSS